MDREDRSTQKDESTPKWLQTIQLNSWEAELLVSALVIYGLYQVPDFLTAFALQNFERGSDLLGFFSILKRAVQLLSLGYILHIIVRGMWVASIGLSYVFPKGVNRERLNFKGRFDKELDHNGSLTDTVLKLEELASLIYGISFILFGTLAGFGLFMFTLIYLIELFSTTVNGDPFVGTTGIILGLLYLLSASLVFTDFLTTGFFRRKKWSAGWFFYLAVIFRVITLSFLYRKSLLVLISNIKGWKSYLVPFALFSLIFLFVYTANGIKENNKTNYYVSASAGDYQSSNYENIRSKDQQLVSTIQSEIITQKVLKLYLNDLDDFADIFVFEKDSLENLKWEELSSQEVTSFFNEHLKVKVDYGQVEGLNWFKTQHPETHAFGFTTFIDLEKLGRGGHFLTIGIDTVGLSDPAKDVVAKDEYSLQTISRTYFFYDEP